MAPRMLHPQLRRGFFKERGVREIDRRRKFHFSFLFSFTRKLSAIFSARNLKMAEKPPDKWPPVLGHHAAIRRAPDSFSSGTATVALFLCSTAEPYREMQQSLWDLPPADHSGWAVLPFSGRILLSVPWCPCRVTQAAQLLLPCHPRLPPWPWPEMETRASILWHSLPTAILLMVQGLTLL